MGKSVRWVIGAVVAVVLAVVLGPWVYINFVKSDAPERLSVDTAAQSSTPTSTTAGAPATGTDGTWKVATGSQAGYRVKEILFGQSTEAVGRTSDVTGQIEVQGARVPSGEFSVDMASVASDESRRDNQYRRVMDVSSNPTSTFKLTQPIELGSVPGDGEKAAASATGDLTLRGTTRNVTIPVEVLRSGSTVKVSGSFPITFADWGIPNPSFGPAETADNGVLEFLLVLNR
ncbi:MAG TPA: YceI family protein [Acidimicrobiales bacterium]|nr:YceI family protein [Acidimicrobiales bacterium]